MRECGLQIVRRLLERRVMRALLARHFCNGSRDVAQNLGEKLEIQMQMHRFAGVEVTRPLQHQRKSLLVEMRVEARGAVERPDGELLGISSGISALSGIGLVMAVCLARG